MSDASSSSLVPLSESKPAPPPEEDVTEYLAFMAATERFAIPLSSVREILLVLPITNVPRSPREILGIIVVRGTIVTVFDSRFLLKVDANESTRQTRIILVKPDGDDEVMGLMVDQVLQVYRLAAEEVEPATAIGADFGDHVMGVGRPNEQRRATPSPPLTLLDPKALFR